MERCRIDGSGNLQERFQRERVLERFRRKGIWRQFGESNRGDSGKKVLDCFLRESSGKNLTREFSRDSAERFEEK